jgi:hypothetical protein
VSEPVDFAFLWSPTFEILIKADANDLVATVLKAKGILKFFAN